MNNTCKQIEVEYQNLTIIEMISEIERLTQELTDAKVENYMLRNDNEALHNRLNEEESDDPSLLDKYEKEYLYGCESEEDLRGYEKAFDNYSLKN